MKIGLVSPLRSPVCTPSYLQGLAKGCDDRDIHSIWLGEHVVTFPSYESRYPGTEDGVFRMPDQSGLLGLFSSTAFLAAASERVRIGTGVCILPQNNPVYVAKEFATVDFLSNGRLDFGIGVGWSWEEFEACGVPFERRGARRDEYLEIIDALRTDESSSYEGEFYTLPPCHLYPKPIQTPMPITIGGHSKPAYRRLAKYGSKFFGTNLNPEQTRVQLEHMDEALAVEGRTRDSVWVIMGLLASPDLAMVEQYAEVGVDELLVPFIRHSESYLEANLVAIGPYLEVAATLG